MFRKYTYYDFEEAYYHLHWDKCKEIGLYLLSYLKGKDARELEKELSSIEYRWDLDPEELAKVQKIFSEVKVWLMVNYPC